MNLKPLSLIRGYRQFIGKRYLFITITLICIVVAAGFALNSPHRQNAHAAGATLSVTPTSGAYSAWNQITVNGQNYAANENVNIYWNYTGPRTGSLLTTVTADGTGMFSTAVNRTLAATGTYLIAGIGQTSGLVASAPFQLLPQIYAGPLDTGPGTQIHVNGNAFAAGETVNVYLGYTGPGTGTLLTSGTGNSTGSFVAYGIIPKTITPGFNTIAAIGQISNTIATAQSYIYPPTLSLAPLSGSAGTTLTYSAYGFAAYENVSLHWNNATQQFAFVKTSIYGYLSIATFIVPPGTSPGTYTMEAIGQTSHITITNTFTVVAPSITLNSVTGPVGTSVHISGQGYAPKELVNVLWNYAGSGTGTNLTTITAGLSGTINGTITVPAATNGAYNIAAGGVSSQSVSQNTFTVQNGLSASSVSVSPGATLMMSGTGFQPNEAVSLYWDTTTSSVLATGTADANGNLSQALTLPTTATHATHTIIAVGQSSQHSLTTSISIDTGWTDLGFNATHTRENTVENVLNPTTARKLLLKWKASTNIQVANSGCGAPANVSSPIYANGIVYYATDDGYLNAYNASTGALKWQFNSQSAFPNCSSPLVDPATGLVFFGTVGYNGAGVPTPFYALDAQTGVLKWSMLLPWNEYSFPTVSSGTLYIGTSRELYAESLYSIDELTGSINWTHLTTGGVWGEVVVDTATNTLYTSVGNPTPHVDALNVTTGALVWEFTPATFGNNDDVGAPLSLANGMVYVSSKSGIIYALNKSNGNVVWSTQIGARSNQDMSAPAVSSAGIIYVGSNDSPLYALNANTGAVIWKYTTRGPVYSSPAIANGLVYFASTDHRFYAVNATTGALMWTYLTKAQSYSSPIVVNGWLYCGSSDGKLYAFSL